MLETRIARRYLWATRKRAHTAFLSIISMLGLAVGVATLLISIALLSGLQGQIKARLIASSPQLLVEPAGGNTIDDADAIVAAAKSAGMRDVYPIVAGIGFGSNEEERRGRPMRARSESPTILREGEIAVTRDFAASVGLDRGDQIVAIAPRVRLTPFGPVPVIRKYTVARLLPPASDERPFDAYLPFAEASSFFATGGKPTAIEMYGTAAIADSAQNPLAARFPGVTFKTWREINRPLFLALRLEKIVMFATISLIIFVAALNLISSLSMLIME
ncbi:MAG: ABC transporter permease, partial [Thermoanaerobaculia bacterium]|nr:ABC transporter permease [Thermoanaerobaculia bacterium]